MKRRWQILIVFTAGLAALLVVNALVVDQQTKGAEVTIDGGRILELPGGDVQVYEEGPAAGRDAGRPPIVLIHCYSCSLHWWDRIAPTLAARHRVVRVDLLGHGGSEKPEGGYSVPELARLVAAAMSELGVQGAVVVGHSLGGAVATSLAEQSSELVDRIVNIDEAADSSFGSLPFVARLAYVPVIGPALSRVTPDFAIRDGYGDAFAPGYELADGFDDADQVVTDFRAMTYTSFDRIHALATDYGDETPLDARLRAALVPLLVIFGAEDQLYDDPEAAADAYADVPGARIAMVEGAGHSPNVEKPQETAALILEFASEAGDEAESPLPGRRRNGS